MLKSDIKNLNNILRDELSKLNVHINSPITSIPNTLNISTITKSNKEVYKLLEDNDIYVSTTSACSKGDLPSKAVLALTKDENRASNTIRISLSHKTTIDEVKELINILKKIL